jgi:hypothetical protein
MTPRPVREDLQPLAHLLQELQHAQSVPALRRFVRGLHRSIPATLLAQRLTADLQDTQRHGVVPIWLYPETAIMRWDNGRDFIIELKCGVLARWDNRQNNWVFCDRGQLGWRLLVKSFYRRFSQRQIGPST